MKHTKKILLALTIFCLTAPISAVAQTSLPMSESPQGQPCQEYIDSHEEIRVLCNSLIDTYRQECAGRRIFWPFGGGVANCRELRELMDQCLKNLTTAEEQYRACMRQTEGR